ncbi:hypothetical protein G3T14_00990 [Methylobacterium sp. BTF04]|uniref:spermidine synthase n=1 Tax=Methylobacterium sp. BTF04 TaxID=2708300 RepID=UPI0013CFE0A8|nr:hypothetical protein [Methylobacterium sp. BTF04]NEU10705.1 hypothetical protein [Methylobacterium sp. BTF04]
MPWTLIDSAEIPGGAAPMQLLSQGDTFSIRVGTAELMTNRDRDSEQALATMPCARLRDHAAPRLLIGGLGMGFTLRAALDALGLHAEVVVAELMPAVIAWARGPLTHLFGGSLDDPRVDLVEADVNRLIQSGPAKYDAILLDVDNGPAGMMRRQNDRLYDAWGLRRAHYALRPGGILAVWSGGPDRRFKARLRRCGFSVEEIRFSARKPEGSRHVLWIAQRGDTPAADVSSD